jgi:hypothetical protein
LRPGGRSARIAATGQVGAELAALDGDTADPRGAGERYGIIDGPFGDGGLKVGAGLLDLLGRGAAGYEPANAAPEVGMT